jgi:hypothetical protein
VTEPETEPETAPETEPETAPETAPAPPALRVVRGAPSAEELAVLTAVIAAAGGDADAPAAPVRRGGWSDPARQHRRPFVPGDNAWRSYAGA